MTRGTPQHALKTRPWTRWTTFGVLALLLATGGWWVRWSSPEPKAFPDTFWYARSALQYAGADDATANLTAAKLTCDGMLHVGHPYRPEHQTYSSCVANRQILPDTTPDRWQRIFSTRPGYGLLAAPLVRLAGPRGFAATTALLSIACGVAMAGLALAVGLGRVRALAAIVLFYWLPTGYWATRLHAEVPMFLFMIVALTGAVLLLRSNRGGPGQGARSDQSRRRVVRVGAGLVIVGLAALLTVKSANGVTTAAALLGAATVVPLFRRIGWAAASPRSAQLLAAISGATLVLNFALGTALGLPGIGETVQDTLTYHFSQPDVANPWGPFFDEIHKMWVDKVPGLLADHPVQVLALAVGAVGLFLRFRRDVALLMLLALTNGPVLATIHPYATQFLRLTVVLWVPVALGIVSLLPDIRGSRIAWSKPYGDDFGDRSSRSEPVLIPRQMSTG